MAMKNPLPPTSRYASVEIAHTRLRNGREVAYLRRRFIPPLSVFATLTEHLVVENERIDHIATTYVGDPEMFWLICDANRAMDPADLTAVPGRRIRITLPAGLPGPQET